MALRSIRSRLLVALLGCAGLIILAGSVSTYFLVRAHMYDEFDKLLKDKLRYHKIAAVQNGTRVSFLISQPVWERIHDPDDPEYFQFRFPDGRDVYRSYGMGEGRANLPLVGLGDDAYVAHDCVLPNGRAGRCMGMVFTPTPGEGVQGPMKLHLVVAREREEMNATLRRLQWWLWGAIGLAAALSAAATLSIIRHALRPVGDLSEQIAAMPVGREGGRFELEDPPTEIAPVVGRLNELMGRVEGAIEHERQFTSNAAHELRNPLAGLRSQLELALSGEREPDADGRTLERSLRIQRQMEGVVDNLLALARLDAGRERPEAQALEVAAVIRKCWKPYFETAAERELEVHWELEPAPELFWTAPALFEILVSNLFDNACSHAPQGGEVRVAAEAKGDDLRLSVRNTNPGVAPSEAERLLKRFGRHDASASGGRDHAGIGLSLCSRIAETLEGELRTEIDADWFAVIVDLPSAAA